MTLQCRRVACCQFAAPDNDFVELFHLLDADGRLNVGEAEVVAEAHVLFEDHLFCGVADRIGNTHPMLSQEAELPRVRRVIRRNHAPLSGRDRLRG